MRKPIKCISFAFLRCKEQVYFLTLVTCILRAELRLRLGQWLLALSLRLAVPSYKQWFLEHKIFCSYKYVLKIQNPVVTLTRFVYTFRASLFPFTARKRCNFLHGSKCHRTIFRVCLGAWDITRLASWKTKNSNLWNNF